MHRCPKCVPVPRPGDPERLGVMAAADVTGSASRPCAGSGTSSSVRSIPELYRLTAEQLMEVEGFAEISARNAVEAIQASKAIPFARVLYGLNIPDVGWVTAQTLARHFGNVDALTAASPKRWSRRREWAGARRGARRVVRRRGPTARRRVPRGRPPVRGGRGRTAGRGAAHGAPTSSRARSSRSPAKRRKLRSRRAGRRWRIQSRGRRPASSCARSRARRSCRKRNGGRAAAHRGRPAFLTRWLIGNSRSRGWGPARGALRPPRPAPRPTGLATGRVGRAPWCRPSPRPRELPVNHLRLAPSRSGPARRRTTGAERSGGSRRRSAPRTKPRGPCVVERPSSHARFRARAASSSGIRACRRGQRRGGSGRAPGAGPGPRPLEDRRVVMRSSAESPEPSAMRTPSSGIIRSAGIPRGTAAPAASSRDPRARRPAA